MDNLHLEETKYTPLISLDTNGTMSFKGKSYPENSFEFYSPVMDWLEKYFENSAAPKSVVSFDIIYFNSSSSKLFFDLFDLLEEESAKNSIEVNWYYDEENESALEAGEDFAEDFTQLKINLIKK